MMKFNVAHRELILKDNKIKKNKKILNIGIGKNKDDYINERKTLNYNNIFNLVYKTDEVNKETKYLMKNL